MDDDQGPARGRRRNLAAIVNLYGAPGFERDTPRGRELLLGVIEEMPGLTALTDEAVCRLANRHREADAAEKRLGGGWNPRA